MSKYEDLVKQYCYNYSLALERIIKEAKNRKQVLSRREELKAYTRKMFDGQVALLPENQKKKGFSAEIMEKYMRAYSESLDNIFDEERKDKSSIFERKAQLKRVTTESYESEIKRLKSKRKTKIFAGAIAGAVVAGGILAGTLTNQRNNSEEQTTDTQPAVSDTMPQEDGQGLPSEEYYSEVLDGAPEIRSYTNANGEFLRLDNIVDINTWAYNEVASELKAYQEANPNGKYDFDMSMISPATGCAVMIVESSGAINSNTTNPNFQGPYSIGVGDEYIESINTVAQALTGENCIDPNNVAKEVQDPRIACKAYFYDMIENYRQLKYALRDAGLSDVEITKRILDDSNLNGSRGSVRKITEGRDHKRPYADKITDYEEVFEDYADDLEAHPEIREQDSSEYGRKAHQRLNKITEKYSNTPTRGGDASADEMD